MDDLINLESKQKTLYDIILSHCNHDTIVNMGFFKGKPLTLICNLQQLSQELLTSGNLLRINYEKNRKPNETDPNRVTKIINYQLGSYEDGLYDTSDWKLTFGMIGNNYDSIRLMDGGHRLQASLELPNVSSYIQIIKFKTEEDRFEKFQLINTSTDLPEKYRLSQDDVYKQLIDDVCTRLNMFFVPATYTLNRKTGCDFFFPFLVNGSFTNFILSNKHIIFGNFDYILMEEREYITGKCIETFITINQEIVHNILIKQYRSGQFPDFSIALFNISKRCQSFKAIRDKTRCPHPHKPNSMFCGYHSIKNYDNVNYEDVLKIISETNIAIGMIPYNSILERYKSLNPISHEHMILNS